MQGDYAHEHLRDTSFAGVSSKDSFHDSVFDRHPSDGSLPPQGSAASPIPRRGKDNYRHRQNGSRMPSSTANSSSISLRSVELERLADFFLYREGKVAKSQARVLELRDRLLTDRNHFRHDWRWLHESQQALMDAMHDRVLNLSNTTFQNQPSLRELYEQAHLDRRVLEDRGEKLHELEDRLGALENILQKRLEKLAAVTKQMVDALHGRFSVTGSTPFESDSMSDTSDSVMVEDAHSDGMNPVLADYYEKAGHFKNMRERLANVQIEYQEARAVRNLQEDQEILQELSDSEFQLRWDKELESSRQELLQAEKDYDEAKLGCISSGFTPYTGRKPPSEPDADASILAPPTETPFKPSLFVDWEASPQTTLREQGTPFPGSPLAMMYNPSRISKHNRVQSWIAEVDTREPQIQQFRASFHERRPSTGYMDGELPASTGREEFVDKYKQKLEWYVKDIATQSREPRFDPAMAYIPPRPMSDSCFDTEAVFEAQRKRTLPWE